MATSVSTKVSAIAIADIEKVYVGAQGCACGCGGEYIDNTPENLDAVTKYAKRINSRIKSNIEGVDLEYTYASIEYTTRAIRLYFKDGIDYHNFNNDGLTRQEEVNA